MIDITEYEIMKNWKGDKNTPLVSICTITYNHEKYIAEALDSFLMQKTDFPIEIVIDDDCSTDDTAKVINKYIKKYPNIIRANFRSENVGMMANFIGNINKANGEYIALCEGDDYWIDKNKLSYQVEEMELHKKCDLSFHSAVELAGLNKGKIISNHSKSNKVFEVKDVILGGGEFCPTASLLFKKSVLTNLSDLMSKAPVGDHFIQIIAASSGGALFLSRAMSIYRVGHLESWLSNMKRLDKMSVIESIENRAKHTNKHINTLKKMKKFIDKNFR